MTSTQRRPSGKDEPEDLRHLRREHGGSLATLKELFADWSEEDLLYAIQDAGGDVEAAILRISDGHASQWGEVKGKKKTPKPKSAQQEYRGPSQRGGFADRGSRGRGDGFRGGRGGSTRGAPRAQNGGDRNTRPVKTETEEAWPAVSEKTESAVVDEAAPSWAKITASSVTAASAASAAPTTSDGWGATPSSSTPAEETKAAPAVETVPATESIKDVDPWGDAATNPPLPGTSTRKVNTSTIPAGTKMSWAKIVKPEPVPQPAPPKVIPAPAPAPEAQKESKPVEHVPEPVVEKETVPETELEVEATPAPEETPEVKEEEPEAIEPTPAVEEEKKEEPEPVPEPVVEPKVEKEPEHTPAPAPTPAQTTAPAAAPAGPPGLKQKPASQPRRLNQDAPVVIAGGSSSLQSMGLKFGSFSLNDTEEPETPEVTETPEVPVEEPAQPAPAETQPAQPTQPAQQATQQPSQQQPSAYGRQPAAASTPAAVPAASGQSPASANAYAKQDPAAANYLAQHHHHPAMGLDAMGSPYGSYMPGANQLGSFGMAPMASLPNEYAALYGNDIQRAMYYDPASYGQMPATGINSYQARDTKYNQDSTAAVGTTGAASTGSTQAQQTLQQQQQQQAYPNMGGMPYYPYYYMPNQFPNAYQQSGYGQPFVNKNMYPMYQHQQQQQQQQHGSNKPGSNNNTPYGNYSSTGAGQGGHHQYSQTGYDDMSGAGLHSGMGLANDSYTKYGYPGTQNFLGSQQGATPTTTAGNAKGNTGSGSYNGADKNAGSGAQPSNAAGGASLQGQQGSMNQGQQGYYQQQMFSNYQYPNHHQGYHPNQHQGQHQGSGRNNGNNNQQYWTQ
ncbi:RNAPII degradation factor [Linnemannia gamsii]|uniref:RNA polymerase II degradation factor 1 n=1 Tax=Linnemannia gamsii TaxID=64522 RepID=A0ABQ7JLU0_9FUNG|nr:RNAPII degradation factor [Linnemannia gamsii]